MTRRLLREAATRLARTDGTAAAAARLTEREAQVLHALAAGKSNAEIAEAMYISLETVESHIKSVLGRLGVRDRTQAVVWAYRSGFTR